MEDAGIVLVRTLDAAVLAVVAAAVGPVAVVRADPPQTGHAYTIEAQLDPRRHEVTGLARIHWRNLSETAPANELYFHLYLNAFANDRSVFMRESHGELRGVGSGRRGGIDILSLTTKDGLNLLAGARTNVVHDDATQMLVPLPAPIAPGGEIDLDVRFRSRLPEVFARAGYSGDFHMVAQWFPKIARREPDGHWATFPYHGNGEFYADFARYELVLRVPEQYVVGATGALVEARRDRGFVVRRFVAPRVHDAAWVAWPNFIQQHIEIGRTRVRFLSPPGFDAAVETEIAIVRAGLRRYGRLFGAYPYRTLTVVIPPPGAEGAAGMEYPTLIMTGGPWVTPPGLVMLGHEDVTAHELAHEWFYGLVASNEVAWPMLDEGLTQWTATDLMRVLHGERSSAFGAPFFPISAFELYRTWSVRRKPPPPPPGLPAYAFDTHEYGASVYARTALVLETVRRVFGRARFERALSTYARANQFMHPTPDDLFGAFDAVYGPSFSRDVLRPALMRGATSQVRLSSLSVSRSQGMWVADVEAQREGDVELPTWVELRTESRRRPVRIRWPAGESRLRVTHTGRERIVEAEVDPDRAILLDASVVDNIRAVNPPPKPSGLFAHALFFFQTLLSEVGP